ncbi:hypothetical protein J6590_098650 [Homalodisca vitripennis]|nr:hypothetical protein J6590_098650 [Homalodisca vitripennis]
MSISPSRTRTEATRHLLDQLESQAILEASDVAQALVDALATTSVTQICEMVITPIPTNLIY